MSHAKYNSLSTVGTVSSWLGCTGTCQRYPYECTVHVPYICILVPIWFRYIFDSVHGSLLQILVDNSITWLKSKLYLSFPQPPSDTCK